MSNQKVVLITGASSGVGRAAAQLLAHNGYKVFGTSRNPSGFTTMSDISMLELDVRSDESVEACMKAVFEQAGRLDILVNNAGYELSGAIEETALDEVKAQFDTNFFGVLRMVKTALPLMRQQKQGQIINISSLAGFVPIPFMGIYSASKFALEGYTEALRYEISHFNIMVSQIEVGFLKSPMMQHRQVTSQRMNGYDLLRQRAFESVRNAEEKGPGPELVAKTIHRIITSKQPRLRYVIGQEARSTSVMKVLLPGWAFEMGVRSTFHLDLKK